MPIIWCMVPEILSMTDRIFCYFGPFFVLLPSKEPKKSKFWKNVKKKKPGDIIILHKCVINDSHMMYGSWDMKHDGQNFFVILDHFLPCYFPNNPKSQNFEKPKKILGDIIILHKCTKNHDHMLYYSWDMMRDRCNCYFSFWAIFCPFTPLTAQKIKILKKWKKHLEISSFYICVPKIMIRWCMVPEIWCMTDVIIFHFGPFFALLPP